MSGQASPPQDKERRTHRRLGVGVAIRVTLPDSEQSLEAINQDISWGGASFLTRGPIDPDCHMLTLTFPWRDGKTFSAEAEVIRVDAREDGHTSVAVRFCCLSPRSQNRLEKLLLMLANRETAKGIVNSMPLTDELELLVNDVDELRDLLSQIRAGRLSVTAFGAYQPDQSIQLCLSGTSASPELRLRARVARQQPVKLGDSAWSNLVSLVLRFEHQPKDLERLLAPVISRLALPRQGPDLGQPQFGGLQPPGGQASH